jgi:LacI family transcriptional regulator
MPSDAIESRAFEQPSSNRAARRAAGEVTSHDVARLAGVSQPTVSRALRDDPRVSLQTRERVRRAAETLNYVPSEIGRSLSTRSTRRVAMVADLGNPLYPELMGPVHAALDQHGFRMMLFAEHAEATSAYDRLFDQSIDGVILTTTRLGSTLPTALARRRIPYVMLNRTIPGAENLSCVADNAGGARQVGVRFVTDGHRRIAGLLGPEETSTGRDRERGFRDALADAGVALPERYVWRNWFTYRSGYAGMKRLMAERPGPTAVFCANDHVAVGAINAAIELGMTVPGDVAIIGFDDLPVARWPIFGLTTVHVPFEAMSEAVVELLVKQMRGEGGESPSVHVFPTELVLRGTHGTAPAEG